MSSSANKCPKCKIFILGDYCHICKKNIYEISDNSLEDFEEKDIPDFFNKFFNNN